MGQIYKVASALVSASGKMFYGKFGNAISQETRDRITNALENMQRYPSIFDDLEKATGKPGAQNAEWRAQVDAIIYTKMDDNAAQKLVALIETVGADGK